MVCLPVAKVRALIVSYKENEIGKLHIAALDSVNQVLVSIVSNQQEELTVMRSLDSARRLQIVNFTSQVGVLNLQHAADQDLIAAKDQQITGLEGDVKKQKAGKILFGSAGSAVIVFLSYLLLKK